MTTRTTKRAKKNVKELRTAHKRAKTILDEARQALDCSYEREGMTQNDLGILVGVWLEEPSQMAAMNIVDAMRHYPEILPYSVEFRRAPAFPFVVKELIRCRMEWPKAARTMLLGWLYHRHPDLHDHPDDGPIATHVLANLSRWEEFDFIYYRRWIVQHGSVGTVTRMLSHEKARKEMRDDDYGYIIKRFSAESSYRFYSHRLIDLAKAPGLPSHIASIIVDKLIEKATYHEACDVVKFLDRPDLLVKLEDYTLTLDLHGISGFLHEFPHANKEKFREVVRKLLTPDPEDIVNDFLNGNDAKQGPHGMTMTLLKGLWGTQKFR
jgi:hypothetical protein